MSEEGEEPMSTQQKVNHTFIPFITSFLTAVNLVFFVPLFIVDPPNDRMLLFGAWMLVTVLFLVFLSAVTLFAAMMAVEMMRKKETETPSSTDA